MRTTSGIQKWMSVAMARNRLRGAVRWADILQSWIR